MKTFRFVAIAMATVFVIGFSTAPGVAHHKLGHAGGPKVHSAPEIDVTSGLAAVAAILAGLALAWERRRSVRLLLAEQATANSA